MVIMRLKRTGSAAMQASCAVAMPAMTNLIVTSYIFTQNAAGVPAAFRFKFLGKN